MKKILIILFYIVGLFLYNQNGNANDKIITDAEFQDKVFTVDLSKDAIYDKIISWIAENFKSSKAVIEVQDKENGKIIGNGNSDIGLRFFAIEKFKYTIVIDIKDNKYKVKYINLFFNNSKAGDWSIDAKINTEKIKQKAYEHLVNLSNQLYDYINTKEKDW